MGRLWADREEGEEAPCQEKSSQCPTPPNSLGVSEGVVGPLMGAPTRGGAATEAEREKNRLTRGLEGYFKEHEFYHLLTHSTMMCCQRVLSTSC